jgi:hypothetical protein
MTITAATRAIVLFRAFDRCERCGAVQNPLELHHRLYRSRGGQDGPENLVALCGRGNTSACHGWAHGQRDPDSASPEFLGYALHAWQDPTRVPVLLHMFGMWAWLLPSGDYEFADGPGHIRPAVR